MLKHNQHLMTKELGIVTKNRIKIDTLGFKRKRLITPYRVTRICTQ